MYKPPPKRLSSVSILHKDWTLLYQWLKQEMGSSWYVC
jgi:hypothetical protein